MRKYVITLGRQGLRTEFWWGNLSKQPVGKARRRKKGADFEIVGQ
jgi:hypothetical protein